MMFRWIERWSLALTLVGLALFHLVFTVPWGEFEYRDQDSLRKWQQSSRRWGGSWLSGASVFRAKEPADLEFAPAMGYIVQRAVGMARSRAITKGARQWFEAQSVSCLSVHCEFRLCEPASTLQGIVEDLSRLRIEAKPGWKLRERGEDQEGCTVYRVEFLQMPRKSAHLDLRADY